MEHPDLKSSIPIRYAGLDYLRGAMALAVLVFHFDKWLLGVWNPGSIPGRLGIYAVAVFFILSGLTLALVYENTLTCRPYTWFLFYKKRIFRIFPLLWLATAATLLFDDQPWSHWYIFLNFSGLFGFVNPATDIATGAWSIGCELVYYAAFPLLLCLIQRDDRWSIGIFTATIFVGWWLAFAWFAASMTDQSFWWPRYVQAANHAFFFAGGVAIAVYRHRMARIPGIYWQIIALCSALFFCLWPVGSNPVALITGWDRVFFSSACLLFTLAYFNSQFRLPPVADRLFRWLGHISYSIYLLHPLVFRVVKSLLTHFFASSTDLLFPAALLSTLAVSHICYYYFEKMFFIKSA